METRKFFITKEHKVRFAHTFLRKIDYDYHNAYLVVSMENNYNAPCMSNCIIEEIDVKNFFTTKEECQFEIIRRERFEPKK